MNLGAWFQRCNTQATSLSGTAEQGVYSPSMCRCPYLSVLQSKPILAEPCTRDQRVFIATVVMGNPM